ncbi:MAG: AEC family transporter [Polyangiaceae bacterium]
MTNLILLVACFGLGALARRLAARASGPLAGLPPDAHRIVNAWIMNVSLPALVLRAVRGVLLEPALFIGAAMLWLELALAIGLALLAIRTKRVSVGVGGALALTAGLGNTAFVGLPLIEALGGQDAMAKASVIDQLGSFAALAILAVPFAVLLSGKAIRPSALVLRLVTFPPFIALFAALVLRRVALPGSVEQVISRLADMLSPLALASMGWQTRLSSLRTHRRYLAVGIAYRLVIAPALVFAILRSLGPIGLAERVTIAEAAMAPMVTAGILAAEHRFEPDLAASLVAVGAVLSLVTVPAWWALAGLGG